MNATLLRTSISVGRRALMTLLLAVALLPAVLGASVPVQTADAAGLTPRIRLQVVVKQATIYDDHDPTGSGEFKLYARLYLCPAEPDPCVNQPGPRTIHVPQLLVESEKRFSADTGDTVTLDWLLPKAADFTDSTGPASAVAAAAGYPMYDGQRYQLQFALVEDDLTDDDYLGTINEYLGEDTSWRVGLHHGRGSTAGRLFDGDWTLDYEIRVAQIPNLLPVSVDPRLQPGGREVFVCVVVTNTGPEAAPPFRAALFVDDWVLEDALRFRRLEPAGVDNACTTITPPNGGTRHTWGVDIDPDDEVAEIDERDNRLARFVDIKQVSGPTSIPAGTGTPPTSTPTQTPDVPSGSAKSALLVSAIKLNGQAADGKSDCRDGKSDVSVVVKNAGEAPVEDVTVRLVVDGVEGDAIEKRVGELGPGKERQVRFGGVRLKAGEHTLTVTANRENASIEAADAESTVTANVRCLDAR